jgi:hypothetical protein
MPKKQVVLSNEEAAALLSDTGLLYEINRKVLHPMGLALAVRVNNAGEVIGFAGLTDCCNDPEGILFSPGSGGPPKYRAFMDRTGKAKLVARKQKLGYVVQPHPFLGYED